MLQNILDDPEASDVQMAFRLMLVRRRIREIVDQARQEGKL